ncbi:cytochrome P450 [Algirhabdus cladophorae]|uniref:cytochrome P450 n=1 Tax=Algirhabdus cladophorae TaxID=3377108 RepID=UPI003B84664F
MPDLPVIELNDARFKQNKYGFIEELRAQGPFAKLSNGSLVVLNQEDAVEVFRCAEFRFAFDNIDKTRSPYLAKAIEHELLNMHGDQHARLSRLVKMALRDRVIEGMRETVTQISDELIGAFRQDGKIEFCSQFADPLPARILGPMFGVPYENAQGLNDWIRIGGRKLDSLQTGTGIEKVEEANRQMHGYLRDLLASRDGKIGDDLFSELMVAEVDGDRMSEDELVYLSTELAAAGVDTTRTQLPLILLALLNHPEEMAKLRADPSLCLRAVDEGMRFAPLPWAMPHAVLRDFDYKSIPLKEGDLVYVLVPSANRDPACMPDPQKFDITRPRVRNFSFGAGMHSCPGAQLARLEMSVALERLIKRSSNIALSGAPVWEKGHEDRGLKSLEIHMT